MKTVLSLCLFLTATLFSYAQTGDCDCPKPKGGKFVYFCTLVENEDVTYKDLLMEMSCVDVKNDSREKIKAKVSCMFKRYYDEFGCDNTGFLVAQGNILKYAINQEFEYFIYGVAEDFGVDLNMKDPADGKTLMDFIADEIARYKRYTVMKEYAAEQVRYLQRNYNILKKDYYALHAAELLSRPHYKWGVAIQVANEKLAKYVGKFSLQMDTARFSIQFRQENGQLLMVVNAGKPTLLHPETETVFFGKPGSKTRYVFTLNSETGAYDFTYSNGEGVPRYKAKRLE